MFQAKLAALRGMPAALGTVALVTLTAACGSAASSSGPTVTDKAVAAKAAGNGPAARLATAVLSRRSLTWGGPAGGRPGR